MNVHDSFDHRPDALIGRMLRDHLNPEDDGSAFVARVREAVRRGRESAGAARVVACDLLARWFRPGIAAAAAILVGALLGGRVWEPSSPMSLTEALGPSEAPAELLAADAQPDPQVLLSPMLEVR